MGVWCSSHRSFSVSECVCVCVRTFKFARFSQSSMKLIHCVLDIKCKCESAHCTRHILITFSCPPIRFGHKADKWAAARERRSKIRAKYMNEMKKKTVYMHEAAAATAAYQWCPLSIPIEHAFHTLSQSFAPIHIYACTVHTIHTPLSPSPVNNCSLYAAFIPSWSWVSS